MARFTTTQAGGDQTLRALAEVLREVSPEEPALVSLRRFDASEARRRLGLPKGRALRSRFRLSWPQLCAIAVTGGDQARTLARNLSDRFKPPSEFEIRFALRTVAARLGKETVGQTEYERERKKMDREQQGPYRHGIGCPLPTANQILGQGEWEAMLKLAELQPVEQPGALKGTPVEELIEQFAKAFGATPSQKQIYDWAKASRVSVARSTPSYTERIQMAKRKLAAQGLEMPPRDRSLKGAELAGKVKAQGASPARRHRWSREEVLAGLSRAANMLPAGKALTQDRLLELSVEDQSIPAPAVVQRVMKKEGLTFSEIKRFAAEA